MGTVAATEPGYQIEIALVEPRIIEIHCSGYMTTASAAGYLPRLERMVKAGGKGTCLLYNALAMQGYEFGFPMAHVEPFRTWFHELCKVGVAHTIPKVSFAIATVSLASKANIKGFPTRAEALRWLKET